MYFVFVKDYLAYSRVYKVLLIVCIGGSVVECSPVVTHAAQVLMLLKDTHDEQDETIHCNVSEIQLWRTRMNYY